MRIKPVSWLRIALEAIAAVCLQLALAHWLSGKHLIEHLLAPGADSRTALALTGVFLLLRTFVYVAGPGWVLARLWLRWTHRPAVARTTSS